MKKIFVTLLSIMAIFNDVSAADNTSGHFHADFRLRFESVQQDNPLSDAEALTLRSHLGYESRAYNGFSAMIELEDVRIVGGVDDYSLPPTGFKPGQFSIVPDPETTELDQAFLQYKHNTTTFKLGRQAITYDRGRFIGAVEFRQDRQTFDAFSLNSRPADNVELNYAYIQQRNRIFAEDLDLDSKDHALTLSYKTPVGKLTGYGYFFEVDNNTNNSLDTLGLSFSGATKFDQLKFIYSLEHARQESETDVDSFDAAYKFIEAGINIGRITAKFAYEVLGSDNSAYIFTTPLATTVKFNGWAAQFLNPPLQGLEALYTVVSAKALGGKLVAIYYDFSAERSTPGMDDFGSELDLLYVRKFAKKYKVGLRYASYLAGDSATNKVDTDKIWLWISAKFKN